MTFTPQADPGTADDSNGRERVRREIYRAFASDGAAPRTDVLPDALGMAADVVRGHLLDLAEAHHLVLANDGRVVFAHPFSSINLGFSVMGENTLWWGGCAWDSFAIPHLLNQSVVAATTCPACGTAHAFAVDTDSPPAGDQVAHFLVPTDHIWDDVVHACAHQRIFCNEVCVDDWLSATGNVRGSVFDLATLWRLASRWYEGRLDSPYVRREPHEASEYFQSVGLHGRFWGLPQ